MILTATLILLLVLSAFFSSFETALATLNKAKLKAILNSSGLSIFRDWLRKPALIFSTILIGNNFVNIAFSSILSFWIISFFVSAGYSDNVSSLAAMLATSFLVLLFGEIMPKNIATTYPREVALALGGFMNFVKVLFLPATKVTSAISNKILGLKTLEEEISINRSDIGELSHTLDQKDAFLKIISRVLALSKTRISRIMTPRKDIVGINLEKEWNEIRDVIIDSGISRFPAYYHVLENLAGVIYTREICAAAVERGAVDLKRHIRPAFFIEENATALETYRKLVARRVHIAVVVDEKSTIRGIVTMEDLLEEIFGSILDEYDLVK
ncbi:MAG: HlyC/CorC family transporter [Elusimicrobia bacterium]|nr:HlyC/CorC family transporter [Elusimicrobiota bacterium]